MTPASVTLAPAALLAALETELAKYITHAEETDDGA